MGLNHLDSVSNANTLNVKDIDDVIIEESSQVEVSATVKTVP